MTETILGNDRYRYKFIPNWSRGLPAKSWPTAVAVDAEDRVYISQPQDLWDKEQEKDAPLMFICDPDGNLINSWGSGACVHTHGLYIGAEIVYLCDKDTSKALMYTLDGKIIRMIGEHNVHSDTGCVDKCTPVPHPAGPFNVPTKLVPSAWGDLYASDGYKNARVHRFHSDGRLIQSWGKWGRTGAGHFDLPHSVLTTPDSKVYVCDRFGDRVHVFDRGGEVINVWSGVRRPADLAVMPDGNMACCEHPTDYYYLDELDYSIPFFVKIFDRTGKVLAKLETGLAHGIAVDSRGDIYLANHHTVNKCVRLD